MIHVSLKVNGLSHDLRDVVAKKSPIPLLRSIFNKSAHVGSNVRLATKEIKTKNHLLVAAEGRGEDAKLTIDQAPVRVDSSDISFMLDHELVIQLGPDLRLVMSDETGGDFICAVGDFIAQLLRLQVRLENFPLQLPPSEASGEGS